MNIIAPLDTVLSWIDDRVVDIAAHAKRIDDDVFDELTELREQAVRDAITINRQTDEIKWLRNRCGDIAVEVLREHARQTGGLR